MKKTIHIIVLLFLSAFLSSCELLEQVSQTERFAQCSFDLIDVKVTEVSGVDFRQVRSGSDLNLGDMMSLGQRIVNGSLPAKLEVDVRAANNNSKMAGIQGMAWKVFLEENEFIGGRLNKSVQVAPHGTTTFPLVIDVDLMKMLHQESLPKLLSMIFGINDQSKLSDLGLSVKIKPTYKSATGTTKEFPNWITIRP